nr:probable protein S-acyltransferase 14 [Ipomoea batatas]
MVLGVVGVTYYAVVISNYGPLLAGGGGVIGILISFVVLVLFHCLLVMLLWSYFSVVFTDPGSVPPNWKPASDEERGDTDPLTASEFGSLPPETAQSRIRFCKKCNQLKPARCHHCSVCGRCVLKMDHHCVWVVNCVGALNYKYFLLFLFYTFLETTLVTLSLLPNFLAFFGDGDITGSAGALATTFLAFVLNLAFALSVLGFLIMHISLVSRNTTTIEVSSSYLALYIIRPHLRDLYAYSTKLLQLQPTLSLSQFSLFLSLSLSLPFPFSLLLRSQEWEC